MQNAAEKSPELKAPFKAAFKIVRKSFWFASTLPSSKAYSKHFNRRNWRGLVSYEKVSIKMNTLVTCPSESSNYITINGPASWSNQFRPVTHVYWCDKASPESAGA